LHVIHGLALLDVCVVAEKHLRAGPSPLEFLNPEPLRGHLQIFSLHLTD
jgi:hypothetical protein